MTHEQLLLRVPEAAARLGLGRSTLYALLASGAIRSVHIGRSRRIPASAIAQWVEALPGTNYRADEIDELRRRRPRR